MLRSSYLGLEDKMKRKVSSSSAPLEDDECKAFHKWLDERDIPHAHIPNESRSSDKYAAIRGKKLKDMGMSAGYWDYDVYLPILDVDNEVGAYELIKIEMKRAKKSLSTVSQAQKNWGSIYEKAGIIKAICYGAEEAEKFIEELYEQVNQKKLSKKPIEF
jgi:hypothetical protein